MMKPASIVRKCFRDKKRAIHWLDENNHLRVEHSGLSDAVYVLFNSLVFNKVIFYPEQPFSQIEESINKLIEENINE